MKRGTGSQDKEDNALGNHENHSSKIFLSIVDNKFHVELFNIAVFISSKVTFKDSQLHVFFKPVVSIHFIV